MSNKRGRRASKEGPKPYKIVTISMYLGDHEYAKNVVKELKKQGYTKANFSWLVRQALKNFDPSVLPPPDLY